MTIVITELLTSLHRGDRNAATEIVHRFSPMLRAVSRRAGVPEHQIADVVQTTWLRLLEAPDSIREPEHLGGWLKTVATREAWRTAGLERREVATGDGMLALRSGGPTPEERLIGSEEVSWLRQAIRRLPERQRRVLYALSLDPAPSYEEIAERTGIPIGSIGPTRARALDRLRQLRQEERAREPWGSTPPKAPSASRPGAARRELAVAS